MIDKKAKKNFLDKQQLKTSTNMHIFYNNR